MLLNTWWGQGVKIIAGHWAMVLPSDGSTHSQTLIAQVECTCWQHGAQQCSLSGSRRSQRKLVSKQGFTQRSSRSFTSRRHLWAWANVLIAPSPISSVSKTSVTRMLALSFMSPSERAWVMVSRQPIRQHPAPHPPGPTVSSVDLLGMRWMRSLRPLSAITLLAQSAIGLNACTTREQDDCQRFTQVGAAGTTEPYVPWSPMHHSSPCTMGPHK